jgi:hypothetical protein
MLAPAILACRSVRARDGPGGITCPASEIPSVKHTSDIGWITRLIRHCPLQFGVAFVRSGPRPYIDANRLAGRGLPRWRGLLAGHSIAHVRSEGHVA